MAGLLTPGPTRIAAEELRKQRGSRGLLGAVGEPMSYAPNPVVAAIGQGLLGAQYLTGEKELGEGLASLSDITAMAVGSRLPPAMRKIFAGVNAKTADKAKLAQAEELDKAGVDNRSIWQQTGWFKGPDGKWRFEIDDSNSIPLGRSWGEAEDLKHGNSTVTRRQSALAHPAVSAAYPDSKNIGVVLKPNLGNSGSFSNDPDAFGATITAGADMAYGGKANRSTMLHELQHFAQDKEGFSRGGSPSEFKDQEKAQLYRDALSWAKEIQSMKKKIPGIDSMDAENALVKMYTENGMTDWLPSRAARDIGRQPYVLFPDKYKGSIYDQMESMVKTYGLDKRATPYGPQDMYHRLAGEAEARAVQSRMNMTPKQRGLLFPLDSYDVPLDQLIIR